MSRRTSHIVSMIVLPVFLVMFSCSTTRAQAWVPEKGQASISVYYAHGDQGDHLLSEDLIDGGVNYGKKIHSGDMQSHTVIVGLEYGISNRLALSASIPATVSRYDSTNYIFPPHILPDGSTIDDGVYRGGFQDFRFEARYMSVVSPLVITPFMAVVIPSHHYITFGHNAIGRDLKELHVGLYLGKLLTFISNNLYTQAGYDFAYVEKIGDISANRSAVDFTLGYFVTPTVTVSTTMSYLKSHGGIDWVTSDILDIASYVNHDRHAAKNYLNLDGSVSVDINDALSFFVSYTSTLWGTNIHELRSLALGSNWSFEVPH